MKHNKTLLLQKFVLWFQITPRYKVIMFRQVTILLYNLWIYLFLCCFSSRAILVNIGELIHVMGRLKMNRCVCAHEHERCKRCVMQSWPSRLFMNYYIIITSGLFSISFPRNCIVHPSHIDKYKCSDNKADIHYCAETQQTQSRVCYRSGMGEKHLHYSKRVKSVLSCCT